MTTMPQQTFTLSHGTASFPMPIDFNQRPHPEILEVMKAAVQTHGLDPTQRYVAVGSYGDCVILEGGEVMLVSDSS
jgi:hypothetical protein